MTEQDHGDLLNRAVELLKEAYVSQDQPWHWPRRELRVKEGQIPDGILVHAEDMGSAEVIEPGDALLHAISVCSDSCTLFVVDADDNASFPLLDDIVDIPANYRWLALPEDIDIDEEAMAELEEECTLRGIGIIFCYVDKNYDEIYMDAEMVVGEFLTFYADWKNMVEALSQHAAIPEDFLEPEESEEEYDYQKFGWDSSGEYS